MRSDESFLQEAVELSLKNVRETPNGPFGAVIVRQGQVIAQGQNSVAQTKDPTAHAEIVAIRSACNVLQTFELRGCDLYTSCEPCPMCLGAIYWAHIDRIFYANTKADAAHFGFDDDFIYQEFALPYEERRLPMMHISLPDAHKAFREWAAKPDKIQY